MVAGLWGKKVGMTQVFVGDKVVPVTALDVGRLLVIRIKTEARDGYNAVQVGRIKDRYARESFSPEWLKDLKRYFSLIKECREDVAIEGLTPGQILDCSEVFTLGESVNLVGITKGAGFAGCVRRYGFGGGGGSHGSTVGRRPGSSSFMRSEGKVIKGKRMPGHMGVDRCTVRNSSVVRVDKETGVILVSGSVPGKGGSTVFVRKV
jgi:large subunit ribosomal protein L3